MMSSRSIVFLILGVAVLSAGGIFLARNALLPQPAADPIELAKEEAENRQEARAAFRDPTPATPEQTAEFGPILLKLGKAIKKADAAAVRACFNVDRFADECGRAGVFDKLGLGRDPVASRQFKAGMSAGIGPALAQKSDFFAWEKFDLRRVRLSEDGQEAIVIATHYVGTDADPTADPIRWWLTKRSGEWLIYDFEELTMGMRISSSIAAVATPEVMRNPEQFRQASQALNATFQAVAQQDFEAADKALVPLRRTNALPKPFLAVRSLMEATIAIGRQDAEKGNQFLDEAERHNPDMPITLLLRAAAKNLLGKYEEAIAACNKYLELLGPDATVLLHRGNAQENLERAEEAIASYRLALDFEPDDVECLAGLRRVLPNEKKKEWIDRLKKRRATTDEQLRAFATEAMNDADYDSLDAVATMMRKQNPDSADAIYYAAKVALERKQTDAAVKLLKESFARDGEDRTATINRMVSLLGGAGLGDKVYAACPEKDRLHIFASLAEIQIEKLEDADPQQLRKEREQLDRLIEAHRKTNPKDYWLPFYEGESQVAQNNPRKAEAFYDKALAAIPADSAEDRDRVRGKLLTVLYRLKRGHEAYAKYGPSSDVFISLAWQFDSDKDYDGLKKLIDLHEAKNAKDPNVLFWTGTWHWRSEKYTAAIKSYRAYTKAAANLPEGETNYTWSANSRIVRGFVRLRQFADARAELKSMKGAQDAILEPLIVAATGDVNATLEAVRKLVEEKKYHANSLYFDEDLAPLLRSEKMKPIRDAYPEPKNENPNADGKPAT